jgi:hypothetical protein
VLIFEHGPYGKAGILQECAVDTGGERCWFMAKHLMKSVPARLVRFFRAEVSDRWHLEPDEVGGLSGDREDLIGLLCDCLNFARRRAEAEVDHFYIEFNDKIARAIEPNSAIEVSLTDEEAQGVQIELNKLKDYSSKNVA